MKKRNEEIKKEIEENLKLTKKLLFPETVKKISKISDLISDAIRKNKKVLLCGNGGSAADCQHWAAEMVGRFKKERKGINFISLTTNTSIITSVSNDYKFDFIFSRQIEAIGEKGDLLICFSTSGKSKNIIEAAKKGKEKGLKILSFTGKTPNPLSKISDITFSVPSQNTPRIQEIHTLLYHIISGIVEDKLLQKIGRHKIKRDNLTR